MLQSSARPDATRRWFSRVWFLVGVIALLCVGAAAWIYQSYDRAAEQMLANARARGEPVTPIELETYYAVPPVSEDATSLWLAALAKLRLSPKPDWTVYRELPYFADGSIPPLPPGEWPQLALAEQFLAEQKEVLAALRAAADFGGRARFPDGNYLDAHDRGSALGFCARCLELEALVRLYRGDVSGTAASLNAQLAIAHALEDEPSSMAFHKMAVVYGDTNVRTYLTTEDFSDADLSRLENDLLAIDFRKSLRGALYGERLFGLSMSEYVATAPLDNPELFAQRLRRPFDRVAYLAMTEDWLAVADTPWTRILAEGDAVAARWNDMTGLLHPTTKQLSYINLFYVGTVRRETSRRLSILAIELERYRKRHGAPPALLDELAPEVLSEVIDDPASGGQFRYLVSETDYVVYSTSTRFPLLYGAALDSETGANPALLFRRSLVSDKAPTEPATDDR
ncbi:MAG TPA: hypothetical protein VHD36_02890 [Pirellulales bacterium]|nr:hypothetical protein [Pirellulales bacterium]